jgi:hypothetical protein
MARKLQHKDACTVTSYTRDELHAVLRAIGFEARESTRERIAQEYSKLDLIVLAAISDLERKFGMRRKALAAVYAPLREALSVPRLPNPNARLVVMVSPPSVAYLEGPGLVEEGTVAPLRDVFARVDAHLGAHGPLQPPLGFKPTLVRPRRPAKARDAGSRARQSPKRKGQSGQGASR